MASDVNLFWAAALDAIVSTDYKIQSDKAVSGVFSDLTTRDATDRGDGSYSPFQTTLNGALDQTQTTVVLTSGTNFNQGDKIQINKEWILLGSKSGSTYTGSTRGIGGSIPESHSNGATVYKGHEAYTDSAVDFTGRSVIRYRIIRVQGTNQSVCAEVVAVNPPAPRSTSFTTLYGIEESTAGVPMPNIKIKLEMDDVDNIGAETGEHAIKETEESPSNTTSSDTDGFWSFQVRRNTTWQGAPIFTLTIDVEGVPYTKAISQMPDQDAVHWAVTT